ncbi:MAG: hypothetical protein ABSF35_23155 [Polyangia bacterium]|jgi:hypothetical protein
MNNQTVWMLLTAGVLLPAGCGFGAPYKMSGPSLSGQGVEVGIAGVRCYVNREQDPFPDVIDQDQVDVDLRLQVKNNSSQDAEIAEGRIRLAEADLPAVGPATPEHSGVISVPPGETKQVPLKFEPSGVVGCRHGFELELADSVDLAGSPIALSPIKFAATR